MKVLILVYDGVYLLDFCGPLEIFYDARNEAGQPAFEVSLVA
jgi:putative intracellular protease/amidase